MVLRLLLITVFLLSFNSHAQKKRGRSIYLKSATKQYLKKNYKKSLRTISEFYDIYRPSKLDTVVIRLLAMNFFKLKRYNSANKYFHIVIKRSYKQMHRDVLQALDSQSLDDIEVPDKLLRIYYRLGQIYYYYYTKTQNTAYFRAAEKYFKICEEKEHLDDNASEYLENLAAKKSFVAKKEFTWKWFANAGVLNWQEKLILEDTTTGNQTKLLSNARAMCIGGGFRYTNDYHGFEAQACGFSGSAKISAANPSLYAQDGVGVSGFLLDSGYTIIAKSQKASFTFSLPLFYRDGNYAQPTNYIILGKGQLSAGAMIKGRWELPIVDLVLSVGNLGWTNMFMMQAAYTF